MENQTKTEEIVVEKSQPEQIVTRVTKVTPPAVQTEAPQKVYEKKKTIFRAYQVIWYILGLIEILLVFRLVFKMLGANITSPFVGLIYTITDPLALPFSGIFRVG